MSGTNISMLQEYIEHEVRDEEYGKSTKASPSLSSGASRFPSVESVLDDINRFLVSHTRAA